MTTADPAAAAPRTLVGAVLSRRWRLTQRLGEGGMGEVYAAEPVSGGAKVAIKLLLPDFVTDAPVLTRFLEEARTSLRLIHPNIVRTMECGEAENGTPYIVMELLDGVPLSAYTANGGRVPVAQATPILHGILAGLAAAHAQGIVHRDLKPENVFLTRDDKGHFVVKVLDFGIAKVMDLAGGMGNKTKTGMLLGTPAYMSPEQIKNAKDVDARADLWSAGVMFYEMLTGRVAFPAPTEYARLAAVLGTTPEPIEHLDLALAPLAPFIGKAMQKDRVQRFQSALEMARTLTSMTGGAGAAAGQDAGTGAHALSRLPEVPSIFQPSTVAPTPNMTPPATLGATPPPVTAPLRDPSRTPGGTLNSPAQHSISEPPPNVILAQPNVVGETLPSKDLPMLAPGTYAPRRGIAPGVVVALVLLALLVGAVIGFALRSQM
jgi:eukaryotic-like serine/threonine-protein kinase